MAAPSSVVPPGEEMGRIAAMALKHGLPLEMFEAVNMMAEEHFELNVDQRKLLITAYRIVFSAKHTSLRINSVMEQQEDDPNQIELIAFFRKKLEDDMQSTCMSTLDTVENDLLPFCHDEENATLYNKMIGDTYWLLAMLKKVEDKEPFVQKALTAYETASKKAENLSPANPLWLSVHLTKTAFHYDVMEWHESAYAHLKKAVEEARPVLHQLDEESYKESTEYVKLMDENLGKWSTALGKDPEDTLTLKEVQAASSSSTGYPCPEVPPSVPAAARDEFINRGDWEDDVGLSAMEIRRRKKAAQMKKGRMG